MTLVAVSLLLLSPAASASLSQVADDPEASAPSQAEKRHLFVARFLHAGGNPLKYIPFAVQEGPSLLAEFVADESGRASFDLPHSVPSLIFVTEGYEPLTVSLEDEEAELIGQTFLMDLGVLELVPQGTLTLKFLEVPDALRSRLVVSLSRIVVRSGGSNSRHHVSLVGQRVELSEGLSELTLGAPPGVPLELWIVGSGLQLTRTVECLVPRNEMVFDLAKMFSIQGTVTDLSGNPVRYKSVGLGKTHHLTGDAIISWTRARTDEFGAFRFWGIEEECYVSLTLSTDGWGPSHGSVPLCDEERDWWDLTEDLTLNLHFCDAVAEEADEETATADREAAPGTVVIDFGGVPVGDLDLWPSPAGDERGRASEGYDHVKSRTGWVFSLQPGTYDFFLSIEKRWSGRVLENVQVTSDEEEAFGLELPELVQAPGLVSNWEEIPVHLLPTVLRIQGGQTYLDADGSFEFLAALPFSGPVYFSGPRGARLEKPVLGSSRDGEVLRIRYPFERQHVVELSIPPLEKGEKVWVQYPRPRLSMEFIDILEELVGSMSSSTGVIQLIEDSDWPIRGRVWEGGGTSPRRLRGWFDTRHSPELGNFEGRYVTLTWQGSNRTARIWAQGPSLDSWVSPEIGLGKIIPGVSRRLWLPNSTVSLRLVAGNGDEAVVELSPEDTALTAKPR